MDTTSSPVGTIVVGVDGSPSAQRALRWAADQARAQNRDLTLLHAYSVADSVWLSQARVDYAEVGAAMRDEARAVLKLAREDVETRGLGVTVHEVLVAGDPREALVDLSRDAALVVVGSRGRGPVRSLLLGSVGVALVRRAHCPVVVHRPGRHGVVRRGVLVGADGNAHSAPALAFAFEHASRNGLPLTVLHCYWADPMAEDDERERMVLAEAVAGLQERYPDVPVTRVVEHGAAERRLARMGDRMDLVVVGAHGGGIGTEILVGSVATSVVEHSSAPVAVVPHAR